MFTMFVISIQTFNVTKQRIYSNVSFYFF